MLINRQRKGINDKFLLSTRKIIYFLICAYLMQRALTVAKLLFKLEFCVQKRRAEFADNHRKGNAFSPSNLCLVTLPQISTINGRFHGALTCIIHDCVGTLNEAEVERGPRVGVENSFQWQILCEKLELIEVPASPLPPINSFIYTHNWRFQLAAILSLRLRTKTLTVTTISVTEMAGPIAR